MKKQAIKITTAAAIAASAFVAVAPTQSEAATSSVDKAITKATNQMAKAYDTYHKAAKNEGKLPATGTIRNQVKLANDYYDAATKEIAKNGGSKTKKAAYTKKLNDKKYFLDRAENYLAAVNTNLNPAKTTFNDAVKGGKQKTVLAAQTALNKKVAEFEATVAKIYGPDARNLLLAKYADPAIKLANSVNDEMTVYAAYKQIEGEKLIEKDIEKAGVLIESVKNEVARLTEKNTKLAENILIAVDKNNKAYADAQVPEVKEVKAVNDKTVEVTLDTAKKDLTDKNFKVLVDGKEVAPSAVKSDEKGEVYTLTVAGLEGKDGKVSVNGKEAAFEFATPKVKEVSAINEKTVKVTFSKEVGALTRDEFVVKALDSAAERQYVQSVEWDNTKKVATVTFFNNLPNNKEYSLDVTAGKDKLNGNFKIAITEAAKIELKELKVPAGVATSLDYKVFDANGVDITESTTVFFNSTKANSIDNKKITLNDGDVAFVEAQVVKKDGTIVKSDTVRIVGEGAVATSLSDYTISNKEVNFKADDYKKNTFLTEKDGGYKIQVQAENQYGKEYSNPAGLEFESLNKEVALVDRTTGAITPLKAGKVDVRIIWGNINKVVSFEVGAEAKASQVALDKTSVKLSTTEGAGTESVNVTVKDQYNRELSGQDVKAVSKDETVVKSVYKAGVVTLTAVKAGTAVVEVSVGDVKVALPVTVSEAGTVQSYKVEGLKSVIDKNVNADKDVAKSLSLSVNGYDKDGVKAETGVNFSFKVTDKENKEIIGATTAAKVGTISASNLEANKTYNVSVMVGTLTIATEKFTVVDSTILPTFTIVKDTITVDKSTDLITELNNDDRSAFEVAEKGVADTDAKIIGVKYLSDNSSVVASNNSSFAESINLNDGNATLVITEVKIDLDGDTKTTNDQTAVKVGKNLNVKVTATSLAEAKALADATEAVGAAEKSETTEDIKTAQELVTALPTGSAKSDLQKRIDTIQAKIDAVKALEDADTAVEKAEKSKIQADKDEAQKLVTKLPEGKEKIELQKRIDAIVVS